MRAILLLVAAAVVPLAVIHLLNSITDDSLTSVFFALIIFITGAAWLAGPLGRSHRIAGRS